MLKKNAFYIGLIIIYGLFLTKDYLFHMVDNKSELEKFVCTTRENDYFNEYQELSKLLDIKISQENVIYSKVIIRNMEEFYNKITISKGSEEGIKVGSAVISDEGLIGVIESTSKHASEVMLIYDASTNISVKINDSYGILSSKDNKLYVKNIKLDKEIKPGDKIYTSGLTKIPEGILVGEVENITKDGLELEYIAEVKSGANLTHIKYVGVIMP